jgi:hypothetical protein
MNAPLRLAEDPENRLRFSDAWNGLHSYDPLCPDLECFSTWYQKGKSKDGSSDPSFAYGVSTLEKKACFLFLG